MKLHLYLYLALVMALASGPAHGQAVAQESDTTMSASHAVILGVIEGLTEFLPVSSTGHLLLAERLLKISGDPESERATDTYLIVIQMGAILAVAWVYHDYLKRMLLGLLGKDEPGRKLFLKLLVAFLPAALVGILFEEVIKQTLFGLWAVTLAWLVGGVALVIWGKNTHPDSGESSCCLETLTLKKAFFIGCIQVVAMWPGTSRSLVTILGGTWTGLSLKNSVIFSFLLGLMTLSASSAYDLIRNGQQMITTLGVQSLIIGLVVAYISAWAAVKGMVGYLKNHGMGLFGGYRILLACITAGLLLTHVISP